MRPDSASQKQIDSVDGLAVLFAAMLLLAALAIGVIVFVYEIGKLRGDQEAPSTISSPAPAGQVGSDGQSADAVLSLDVVGNGGYEGRVSVFGREFDSRRLQDLRGRSVSTGTQQTGLTTGEATDLIGAQRYLRTMTYSRSACPKQRDLAWLTTMSPNGRVGGQQCPSILLA